MNIPQNPQLHKHIVSNWHFLPELPEVNVEVLKSHIDDQDQLIFDQTQEISELKAEVDRLRKENEEKRSQVK